MKKNYFIPATEVMNLNGEQLMQDLTVSIGGGAGYGQGADAPARSGNGIKAAGIVL